MLLRRFFKQFGIRILIHIIVWICIVLLFTFFFAFEDIDFAAQIGFSAFLLPVTIVTTYIFIYYLIPKYLLSKLYVKFGLYSIYTFIISAVFIILSAFYGLVIMLKMNWTERFPISKSLFFIIITIYLVVVIASAFSLLKYNYTSISKNEELKNRILEAQLKLKEQELQYLKMQIHPHFLFNTLNTIYGFSLLKNEKTPEMILQLSELLDYILYQTRKPLVKLKDEIAHIKNYVNLEKKRFHEDLTVVLQIQSFTETIEIAPMLLLPFVENSFKHGKDADGKLKIEIDLKIENDLLLFSISNSKAATLTSSEENGIGLKNIRRRLELLYPDHFELVIDNREELFTASMKLNIDQKPTNVV